MQLAVPVSAPLVAPVVLHLLGLENPVVMPAVQCVYPVAVHLPRSVVLSLLLLVRLWPPPAELSGYALLMLELRALPAQYSALRVLQRLATRVLCC